MSTVKMVVHDRLFREKLLNGDDDDADLALPPPIHVHDKKDRYLSEGITESKKYETKTTQIAQKIEEGLDSNSFQPDLPIICPR